MTGDAEFNEVFLTDARVRHEDLVGELGGGWAVALRLLNHERESLDADADGSGIMGDLDLAAPAGSFVGPDGRSLDDGTGPISMAQGQGAAELLTTLVARAGRAADPVTRQRLADLHSRIRIAGYAGGSMPASAGKLASVTLMRGVRDTALELLGPDGTLHGTDAPLDGAVTEMALWTPGLSIAGGTDEVQRNILGERELGLPPEPRVDKDIPFKDLKQPSIRG
ncbi:MAG: acyl-CoA dehydrogenase family protein [Acidimicrobiales bacterium]